MTEHEIETPVGAALVVLNVPGRLSGSGERPRIGASAPREVLPPLPSDSAMNRAPTDPRSAGGRPRALLVLGHGAGGGAQAPDLVEVAEAASADGIAVARFVQPYRLRGRRAPDPPAKLDLAYAAGVAATLALVGDVPWFAGGRSSGARVAVRVAAALSGGGSTPYGVGVRVPDGVVALAFPLVPPGRPGGTSRAGELVAAGVPALVVQGERDVFGTPAAVRAAAGRHAEVVGVAGADHSFRARRVDGRASEDCVREAASVVVGWLAGQLAASET